MKSTNAVYTAFPGHSYRRNRIEMPIRKYILKGSLYGLNITVEIYDKRLHCGLLHGDISKKVTVFEFWQFVL